MEEVHDTMRTMYIGSRESPVLLRIYLKSKSKNLKERERQTWQSNGWDGRSDVWRIEYEMHTKAIPRGTELPRDTSLLWGDCIRRIRMCECPPRQYSQQNKAPTHPWWKALGAPARVTRARSRVRRDDREGLDDILRDLDALSARAGVMVMPLMLQHLHKRLAAARRG